MLLMSKGSKEALTVLIVTHVTHVEGVESSLNSFTHNFLNIQTIFNQKKVLESSDLDLLNHTIQMLCVLMHVEGFSWQCDLDR